MFAIKNKFLINYENEPFLLPSILRISEPAKQVSFGTSVITCLSSEAAAAVFPNLPVSVPALQKINDDLDTADQAFQTGAFIAVAQLKPAKNAWYLNFSATAKYVSMIAGMAPTPADAETLII